MTGPAVVLAPLLARQVARWAERAAATRLAGAPEGPVAPDRQEPAMTVVARPVPALDARRAVLARNARRAAAARRAVAALALASVLDAAAS